MKSTSFFFTGRLKIKSQTRDWLIRAALISHNDITLKFFLVAPFQIFFSMGQMTAANQSYSRKKKKTNLKISIQQLLKKKKNFFLTKK